MPFSRLVLNHDMPHMACHETGLPWDSRFRILQIHNSTIAISVIHVRQPDEVYPVFDTTWFNILNLDDTDTLRLIPIAMMQQCSFSPKYIVFSVSDFMVLIRYNIDRYLILRCQRELCPEAKVKLTQT